MALNFLNDGYFAGKVGIGIETYSKKLTIFGTGAGNAVICPKCSAPLSGTGGGGPAASGGGGSGAGGYCSNCGQQYPSGAKFCNGCGNKV